MQKLRQFVVTIPANYEPEDGDIFDAIVDALQHFEIPAHIVEVKSKK